MKNISTFVLFVFVVFFEIVFLINAKDTEPNCNPKVWRKLNEACDETQECYPFLGCYGGICQEPNYGEACYNDSDCSTGFCEQYSMTCLNQVEYVDDQCVTDEQCTSGSCSQITMTCTGIGALKPCNTSEPGSCTMGYYCSNTTGVCEVSANLGENCWNQTNNSKPEERDFICMDFGVCNLNSSSDPESMFCVEPMSKQIGEVCSDPEACVAGSTCNNNICTANENSVCGDDSDCGWGSYCDCGSSTENRDTITGKCQPLFNMNCTTEVAEVLACVEEVHCHHESIFDQGGCAYKACQHQIDILECCLAHGFPNEFYPENRDVCEWCEAIPPAEIYHACDESAGIYCATNLFCFNNMCIRSNYGAKCTDTTGCTSLNCADETGKCDSAFRYPNDPCTEDWQCYEASSCVNGRCRAPGYWESCDYWGFCDVGYYCDFTDEVCQNASFIGESCKDKYLQSIVHVDACSNFTICDLVRDECVLPNSLGFNETCGSTDSCEIGLACVNNTCQEQVGCFDNKDCANGYICSCSVDTSYPGACIPYQNMSCQQEFMDFVSCASSYNCFMGDFFTQGNCPFDMCREQATKYQCCSADGYELEYFLAAQVYCNAPSPSFSVRSSQFNVFVVLICLEFLLFHFFF
ncbi:dd-gdca protein [Anaeramoeba ignava]|uniref:Dd-gdca protein n=1 Tax=Anaeramoeba ignava TaxID=1746090 RepID=A0A9Q0LI54_ANAIG|nr:dd-gdca protein [Anaeramoeba ignava]